MPEAGTQHCSRFLVFYSMTRVRTGVRPPLTRPPVPSSAGSVPVRPPLTRPLSPPPQGQFRFEGPSSPTDPSPVSSSAGWFKGPSSPTDPSPRPLLGRVRRPPLTRPPVPSSAGSVSVRGAVVPHHPGADQLPARVRPGGDQQVRRRAETGHPPRALGT